MHGGDAILSFPYISLSPVLPLSSFRSYSFARLFAPLLLLQRVAFLFLSSLPLVQLFLFPSTVSSNLYMQAPTACLRVFFGTLLHRPTKREISRFFSSSGTSLSLLPSRYTYFSNRRNCPDDDQKTRIQEKGPPRYSLKVEDEVFDTHVT